MNWSKFKLKKISTVYQAIDSYHFNGNHNADSYLNSIEQILTTFDLSDGVSLSGYIQNKDNLTATFIRTYPLGVDIECVINFQSTTLTIKVIE